MQHKLKRYIYEQILIIEQKNLLEENKVLKALTTVGLAAAVYFATGLITKDTEVSPDEALNKATQSQLSSKDKREFEREFERGINTAQKLVRSGTRPETIIQQARNEPGVAPLFKTLFMNTDKPTDQEKEGLESGSIRKIPIASVEEVTQDHIDHVFKYTPEELQKYLKTEAARSALTISFGDEDICLLDISKEDLSELMNNPESKAFKHVAQEILERKIEAQNATWAAIEAFSNNFQDAWEDNLDVQEIKTGSEDSINIGRAIEDFMKKQGVDHYINLLINEFNNGKIRNENQIESYLEDTDFNELSNDYYEDNESAR